MLVLVNPDQTIRAMSIITREEAQLVGKWLNGNQLRGQASSYKDAMFIYKLGLSSTEEGKIAGFRQYNKKIEEMATNGNVPLFLQQLARTQKFNLMIAQVKYLNKPQIKRSSFAVCSRNDFLLGIRLYLAGEEKNLKI